MSSIAQSGDLKNRILFTIFILAIYRFGTFVPLPGIDPEQLKVLMEGNQKGLLGMFNVFAGGAVSRMAIFALGIGLLGFSMFQNETVHKISSSFYMIVGIYGVIGSILFYDQGLIGFYYVSLVITSVAIGIELFRTGSD